MSCSIFGSSNKPKIFTTNFFYKIFSKILPREQERKTTKKGWEKYLSLSKEEKKKSNKMGVSNIKISMKMIKRRLVKYRKIYYKIRKNTSV